MTLIVFVYIEKETREENIKSNGKKFRFRQMEREKEREREQKPTKTN